MAYIAAEAFLSVEASLTLRLLSTYRGLINGLVSHMDVAARDGEWDKLVGLIDQIDLSKVFELNAAYILYLSNVAMLFGASRVTGESRDTSAVSLGFSKDLIGQVVESFRQMMVTTGEESIKNQALDYMAFLKEPKTEEGSYLGKVLKFHNVGFNEASHPRAPGGSSIGGEFIPKGSPAKAPQATVEALQPTAIPEGTPEYGTATKGAVSVLGVHYSKQAREYLTGMHHGQGLKDAADERTRDAKDKRLKDRIYFYVDEGHGIVPEAGVGGVKHTVLLRNMYDPQMDHAKLWSQGKGDSNASESAVLNAGYDGYYVRNFANRSGVAVLLGDHTVKVKAEKVAKEDMSGADLATAGLKTPDGNKPKKRRATLADIANALRAVKKAEGDPSVLPFSSFVDSAGRSFFNMASSLHTSRLSAFGYTAEAEYLGVTKYKIDEQLDGRTCPVCEYMNGKVFDVEDARGFLDTVVRTQDADELRMLQPWPSQSKAGLAVMQDMSPDELVMSGWHVPPFHPRCRGLLSSAVEMATSPTNVAQGESEGGYLAQAIDFNQLGVKLSPARIDKWNQLMNASPASVIGGLSGMTEQEVVQAALMAQEQGYDPKEKLGLKALTVDSHGTINIELQRALTSSGGDLNAALMDLYFRQDRSLFIGSVELPGGLSEAELASGLRETLMDVYGTAQQVGMGSIEAYAGSDTGGFALAKYGFAPTPEGWDHIKTVIERRIEKSALGSMISEEEMAYLNAILESNDPQDIFAIADLPDVANALLEDTQWQGFFDLNDPESVARFLTYLSELSE